jgi:hypothetical protein
MDMMDFPSRRSSTTQSGAKPVDAFASLAPFGWGGGLVAIVFLLAVSFFAVGYFLIYWRNADMDFMVIYCALSLNDGRNFFFEHPAYLTILSMSWWLQLLHQVGWIDVSSLSAMPSARDAAAFDHAMTELVRAGRALSGLMAAGFVLVFAVLARRLVRDWRIAMFATFAFAFSGGVAVHMRILRSELISGCFFAFAVMILMIVARRGTIWRPLAIGFAALLCVLALENKVHAILLVAMLPALLLPFGAPAGASSAFWRGISAWAVVPAAAIGAGLLFWSIMPILADGFAPAHTAAFSLRPLLGKFGVYQAALLIWIAACIAGFAWLWNVSLAETLATMLAIVGGAALGLSALYIRYDVGNAVVVLNPLEQMMNFADPQATSIAEGGNPFAVVELLLSGVWGVLQRHTFVLFTSTRPAVFLTWLIVPGIIYVWRRGDRQLAVQAAFLMLAEIGVDALGVRRGLKSEYFILTDPLIILAGMILLDRLCDLRFNRWAYPVGVALVVLHVGVSQAEPVRLAIKREGPQSTCKWSGHYLPRLPLPWCA